MESNESFNNIRSVHQKKSLVIVLILGVLKHMCGNPRKVYGGISETVFYVLSIYKEHLMSKIYRLEMSVKNLSNLLSFNLG